MSCALSKELHDIGEVCVGVVLIFQECVEMTAAAFKDTTQRHVERSREGKKRNRNRSHRKRKVHESRPIKNCARRSTGCDKQRNDELHVDHDQSSPREHDCEHLSIRAVRIDHCSELAETGHAFRNAALHVRRAVNHVIGHSSDQAELVDDVRNDADERVTQRRVRHPATKHGDDHTS